ncbi:vomeronasal type-1 receptor 4-like [Suncus etruscus]|uniref:vomeronasal type-1 receptor 4-like n=1 Tax=Suncus etruscus TaxID=109475 RepID=UPI0021108523|nr:vomeronasal type-1 receptor 4-like [Suncus etruscus]
MGWKEDSISEVLLEACVIFQKICLYLDPWKVVLMGKELELLSVTTEDTSPEDTQRGGKWTRGRENSNSIKSHSGGLPPQHTCAMILSLSPVCQQKKELGMIFLMQTVVGVLGNLSLLQHYLVLHFTKYHFKGTDLFIKHMLVANILVLGKGVLNAMALFGWTNFINDLACQLILYLHRVGRGVCIGCVCLLSVFQVFTISSRISRWTHLRTKVLKHAGLALYWWWIVVMLVNIPFPLFITATTSNSSFDKKVFGYYSAVIHDATSDVLYAVLLTSPDVLCLGLVLCASTSMVYILYRHKQRIRHLRTNISLQSSPETRATRRIFLLVSTFVCFYTLSCSFQVALSIMPNPIKLLENLVVVMSASFPVVSPFLLMRQEISVIRLCCISRNPKLRGPVGNT